MLVIPFVLAAAGLGFTTIILMRRPKQLRISFPATTAVAPTTRYAATMTIPPEFLPKASPKELQQILASASKWAKARNIPVQEVLATIQVESKGKVKARAHTAKEDSRGLMQVNINAWGGKLIAHGYTPADLYNIDRNIEIGTEIYAAYRKKVEDLIAKSGKPQVAPLATIVRQYYRGPVAVRNAIRDGRDASTVFSASDARAGRGDSVANWQIAMHYARGVTSA